MKPLAVTIRRATLDLVTLHRQTTTASASMAAPLMSIRLGRTLIPSLGPAAVNPSRPKSPGHGFIPFRRGQFSARPRSTLATKSC